MPNLPESIIESTVTRLMDDKKNRKETEDEIIFEKMFDVIKSQISTVEILISSEEMQQKINEANAQAGNKQDY
jgi:predicted KAP-like P-loop ATPase